jgi:putative ABC transport system substrate-binding protein
MSVVEAAARTMNVEVRPVELGGIDELERAFPIAGFAPLDGVVFTDHPLLLTNAATVAAFAEKRGLPAIGAPIIAAHGGLIGYGVDFPLMFRRAAVFVDKILKGANPGDIPIEQATKFKTIVNLKTAKALGVEIPPTLLASADELIE